MTKENLPISPGPKSMLMTWCCSNPKKTAVVFIIVIAIVFIWIHGPFYRTSAVMEGIPMSLGDNGSDVNRLK